MHASSSLALLGLGAGDEAAVRASRAAPRCFIQSNDAEPAVAAVLALTGLAAVSDVPEGGGHWPSAKPKTA